MVMLCVQCYVNIVIVECERGCGGLKMLVSAVHCIEHNMRLTDVKKCIWKCMFDDRNKCVSIIICNVAAS